MSVDDFFSKLNPLFAAILRSPLHWLLSPGLVLLTVTGRRTGRRYSIPVGYQRDGEVLTIMVSEARKKSWWRNFRQPASIELQLRGRVRSGRAELVAPGSDEFRSAASRTLRRMPWLGRVFGIDYDRHKGLDDDQAKRLGEQIAVVRIALDAAST